MTQPQPLSIYNYIWNCKGLCCVDWFLFKLVFLPITFKTWVAHEISYNQSLESQPSSTIVCSPRHGWWVHRSWASWVAILPPQWFLALHTIYIYIYAFINYIYIWWIIFIYISIYLSLSLICVYIYISLCRCFTNVSPVFLIVLHWGNRWSLPMEFKGLQCERGQRETGKPCITRLGVFNPSQPASWFEFPNHGIGGSIHRLHYFQIAPSKHYYGARAGALCRYHSNFVCQTWAPHF